MTSLSSELAQAQHQLLEKTSLVGQLGTELEAVRAELVRGERVWREKEGELRQSMEQGEVVRRSLLQQVRVAWREARSQSFRLCSAAAQSALHIALRVATIFFNLQFSMETRYIYMLYTHSTVYVEIFAVY